MHNYLNAFKMANSTNLIENYCLKFRIFFKDSINSVILLTNCQDNIYTIYYNVLTFKQ